MLQGRTPVHIILKAAGRPTGSSLSRNALHYLKRAHCCDVTLHYSPWTSYCSPSGFFPLKIDRSEIMKLPAYTNSLCVLLDPPQPFPMYYRRGIAHQFSMN